LEIPADRYPFIVGEVITRPAALAWQVIIDGFRLAEG
jgi:hypothetical protein